MITLEVKGFFWIWLRCWEWKDNCVSVFVKCEVMEQWNFPEDCYKFMAFFFCLSPCPCPLWFTLDESAAFPLRFECRPRARLQHLYMGRTRMKAAEKMGKACFERSLSVSMSFELQIWEITAPCQPVFQETRVREAESFLWYRSNGNRNKGPRMQSNITNNTASSGKSTDLALKAPDNVY